MQDTTPNKNQPDNTGLSASEEMIRLLGLDKPAVEVTDGKTTATASISPVTQPIAESDGGTSTGNTIKPEETVKVEPLNLGLGAGLEADFVQPSAKTWARNAFSTVLSVVPYLLVFVIGVAVYYIVFADPSNRPSIFTKKPDTVTPLTAKAEAIAELKTELKSDYEEYIKKYYFNISDESLLSMDRVADNKLTNFENFLLGLNPRTNDIRKTGSPDAKFVLEGLQPDTGLPLKDSQKDIIAKYFDLAAIQTRINGTESSDQGTTLQPRGPQREGVLPIRINIKEALAATSVSENPAVTVPTPQVASGSVTAPTPTPKPAPSPKVAPLTGPSGCEENKLGIDTTIPGRIEIPSIGVNVPIIWTRDPATFNEDLKTGVVHYPCTPLPGDVGKSYISGHSSNYTWAGGNFNKIFARMNELETGMTFKVTVVGRDGKDIRLFYVVQSKQEYAADDQAQFLNTAYSEVALSTCWPINTTKKRLVTVARLDRIER